MNEVVLRCPNCGTTQEAAGECDACHEASVRHYCPNHTPGRWLDGPACPACGATTDRGPVVRVEPTTRAPTSRAPTSRPPTSRPPITPRAEPPRGRPVDRRPVDRRPIERAPIGRAPIERPPIDRPPAWVPPTPAPASRAARGPGDVLAELRAAARARRDEESATPATARPRLPIAGCVMRFVIFIALLVLLAIGALWLFAGGAVHSWLVDVGQSTGTVGGVPAATQDGIAAYERGDLPTARRELRAAADTYRRSALALLYLSRISEADGDVESAAAYLREATAREPDAPIVRRAVEAFQARHASGRGAASVP